MKKLFAVLIGIFVLVFFTKTSLAKTKIFVYPKEHQSPKRQHIDEDECHQWAEMQTGYVLNDLDEMKQKIEKNLSVDKYQKAYEDKSRTILQERSEKEEKTQERLQDYIRAFSACMEARGYSVR